MKIAFVGGPGLGKTTLALEIASILKKNGVVADFVGEHARTWMAKHGRTPRNAEDQSLIMRGQRKRERERELTQDVVVTDSTTWMCAVYSTLFVRNSNLEIDTSAHITMCDLFEDAVEELDSYTITFVVPRCFGLPTEPGRVQLSESEGTRLDDKIAGFIALYDIPAVFLPGEPERWRSEVLQVLQGMEILGESYRI